MKVRIIKSVIEALVSSESYKGASYLVKKNGRFWFCECPNHSMRDRTTELSLECKHIEAAKKQIEEGKWE